MPIRQFAAAAAVLAAGLPVVAASAAHAAIFVPATIQATCISACLNETKTYTQTYGASAFNGPVSIGAFSFNRALLGADDHSVFHVTFYTADGAEVGDFGHYMVGSLAGDELTLKGQSFAFDPSLGPLTLKLQIDNYGPGGVGGGGGSWGGGVSGNAGYGDVITSLPGVSQGPVALLAQPVPEPAGWALMILGFGGAGGLLRSRRRRFA